MNAFVRPTDRGGSTNHNGLLPVGSSSDRQVGIAVGCKPSASARFAPAVEPVLRASDRENAPVAAPAAVIPRGKSPGTKAATASDHFGRSPRWVVRLIAGFQPPETASVSAGK